MFVFKSFFFTFTFVPFISSQDQHAQDIETYRNYGGCLDLQDAFDVFYSEPCRSMPKVEYLMRLFHYHCPNISSYFREMVQHKRHVFIAVEGTHRETKIILTKILARKLRGKFKFSPPSYLVRTGYKFTETRTMSRAYYCLGYYAAAYRMAMMLQYTPVVTGG
ncbi:uncharacterized protein LOC129003339 [Macrosteles quadrilineatus]|uniref:uncharacterized protein LOC129003339 n=1 Tax=Macrosteles quadrilineatus TaxID=74068 RepID=UPI0023E2F56D|nr:uncharacterized protein LOC129003339 [Macrosteles quadrilineatus]